jgi:ABC-type glycerol-3-phosphate transport system substrate-binding protein
MTYGTFWAEVVSKNSPNKDTAWDFLSFLIENNNNATFLKAISGVPARSDVPNRVSTAGIFVQQLSNATNWLKTTKPEDVNKIFSGMINNVLGGMPSQTAIDKASNDVTKILQQQAKEMGNSPKK